MVSNGAGSYMAVIKVAALLSVIRKHLAAAIASAAALFVSVPAGAAEGAAEYGHALRWGLNMPKGVTGVSQGIYDLHMLIFWICVVIGVVVFGIMFFSMYMHRKSRGAKPADFHENTPLEVLWTLLAFFILVGMAVPSTTMMVRMYDTSDSEVDILVTGYQWKWKYEYLNEDLSFFSNLLTPQDEIYEDAPKGEHYLLDVDNHLVVPVGKKIRFLITAADVLHSWWVPAFAVKQDAIPGFINEAWTIIDQKGIYRGQCAELCGRNHGFMPIVVQAVGEAEYDNWLAERKEAAARESALRDQHFTFEELMARGEGVYSKNCASCHLPNGAGLPGAFPSLLVGSMATGPMKEHLDMVVNGRTGTAMAAFGAQLSEADLAAVITYERNAWGNDMGDMIQPIDVANFQGGP